MSTVRKTITVTETQDAWIPAQVQAGRFTNDSELIRVGRFLHARAYQEAVLERRCMQYGGQFPRRH